MVLAAIGVLLFVSSVHRGDHDQAERMSLLPLEDDEGQRPAEEAPIGEAPGAGGEPVGRDKEGIDP